MVVEKGRDQDWILKERHELNGIWWREYRDEKTPEQLQMLQDPHVDINPSYPSSRTQGAAHRVSRLQPVMMLSTAAPTASSNGPVRKKRKSRGRGLRTTTGCRTCRTRHMKCDEKRDICGPCERSGRECVYKDETDPSIQTEVREIYFRGQALRPQHVSGRTKDYK